MNAGLALHVRVLAGRDPHHIVEAQFKALARALRAAVALDPRVDRHPEREGRSLTPWSTAATTPAPDTACSSSGAEPTGWRAGRAAASSRPTSRALDRGWTGVTLAEERARGGGALRHRPRDAGGPAGAERSPTRHRFLRHEEPGRRERPAQGAAPRPAVARLGAGARHPTGPGPPAPRAPTSSSRPPAPGPAPVPSSSTVKNPSGRPLEMLVEVIRLLGLPGEDLLLSGASAEDRPRRADRAVGAGLRRPRRRRRRPSRRSRRGSAVSPRVVVLDYGSGNVRSAVRALERVGADVTLTGDVVAAQDADGLLVPGVGNFHACMAGLRAADGPRVIDRRLAGGRPVLGVCVGLQVMFEGSTEPSDSPQEGLAQWPGTVSRLTRRRRPAHGLVARRGGGGLDPLRRRRGRALLLRPLVCRPGVDDARAHRVLRRPSLPV